MAGCGEPGKSLREINPVLYMHRLDSGTYAIRLNKVYRTDVSVHNPLDFRTKDAYYPVWYVIPDTVGTFQGKEIGVAVSSLLKVNYHDNRQRERIEIGGGYVRFKDNRDISGKYEVVLRKSDPCAKGCDYSQLLAPVPP